MNSIFTYTITEICVGRETDEKRKYLFRKENSLLIMYLDGLKKYKCSYLKRHL